MTDKTQFGVMPDEATEAPLEWVLDAYEGHIRSVSVTYGTRGDEKWVTSKIELYENAWTVPAS